MSDYLQPTVAIFEPSARSARKPIAKRMPSYPSLGSQQPTRHPITLASATSKPPRFTPAT